MDTEKTELISKLTGIYQYLCGYEQLAYDFNVCKGNLENAIGSLNYNEKNLKKIKKGFAVFLGWLIFVTIGVVFLLKRAPEDVFLSWKPLIIYPYGFLVLCGTINLINYLFTSLVKIPKSKRIAENNQKYFNDAETKFNELLGSTEKEQADTEQMFPGNQYPPKRYVKYGIDSLNSGRADDFKEVMSLIDELAHREKMETEAQSQTRFAQQQARFARQAAINSREALEAARNAESEAKKTAEDISRLRRY